MQVVCELLDLSYLLHKTTLLKISIFKLHFHDDKLHLVEIHDELAVSILPGRWLGHGEDDRGRVCVAEEDSETESGGCEAAVSR